ncbi:exported protein of unknown function [Modestobacter italicus]|uniref:Secreted protein n=1 Tax=Modestobacter italicus (strain DSM 44449 / CECT 9708 / BC 501) TaxID=2732864 RepID=I4F3F1_MODI5|nr:hypothetical protein [Modestobacter marinus]CCH90164.1 exported protein of unknown function [Modestobacter marinus]
MSTRRSVLQRTAALTAAAVLATGLAGAGPAGAAAPAPVADPTACAALLAQVLSWPGGVHAPGSPQVVSDAYESHLLRQPACRALPAG